MADLPYIQQRQEVSVTGQDSTGDQVNYVGADSNGNLFVKDYSAGPVAPGTAAGTALLVAGQYNTTLPTLTAAQQAALQLDSSGRLIPGALTAGKNYIGQVGFNPGTADVFGTLTTGSRQLQINVQFNQGTLANLIQYLLAGTGSATLTSNGTGQFSTGTGAGGEATGISLSTTQYASGCEIYAEFTASFTAPVAGTYQKIGLYNSTGGFYVGYIGTNFGVTVRNNSVDTTVNQSSFNLDTLTGASTSLFTSGGTPVAINLTYLNVFRIRFGWLGAAPVYYEVLSPDGVWVTFHIIRQPNSSAIPSIEQPNLPITIDVYNGTTTSNMVMNTACWGAGSVVSSVSSDQTVTGNLSSTSGSVILSGLNGVGSVNIDVSGTFVGTLTVTAQEPFDSKQLYVQPISLDMLMTTITGPGSYRVAGVAAYYAITVQFSSYTSGTANINIRSSNATTYVLPFCLNADNNLTSSWLSDGNGNSISSINSQLETADVINTSISSGSIVVSTTAVAARVGSSNLTNRKMLMIAPINNTVYLGASSAVTTATGIPIYPGQVTSFAFSANVTPYLISASSGTVNIFEGA